MSVPLLNNGVKRVVRDEKLIAKNLKKHYDFVETSVEQTMSKEQLEHLHKCIRFTQSNLQEESYAKMDGDIEAMVRPIGLPKGI